MVLRCKDLNEANENGVFSGQYGVYACLAFEFRTPRG